MLINLFIKIYSCKLPTKYKLIKIINLYKRHSLQNNYLLNLIISMCLSS